jgi:hypothetical protein
MRVLSALPAGMIVVALAAAGSCSHDRTGDRLTLRVAADAPRAGALTTGDLVLTGSGRPKAEILAGDGGTLRSAPGSDGDVGLRTPHYQGTEDAPTAVVAVTSGEQGWMDPGRQPFEVDADVYLDPLSEGTAHDNGDNVVQRGLFTDPVQFKLQVDHRRPSCLVRGARTMVLVQSSVTLEPRSWYRLRCVRSSDAVELTVSSIVSGSPVAPRSDRVDRNPGLLEFPSSTPLTVAGKVGADGQPAPATDQFNGRIDHVLVSIGSTSE